jgi:hypothetical protein
VVDTAEKTAEWSGLEMKRMTKEQEMEEEESISTTMEEIGRVEDITF